MAAGDRGLIVQAYAEGMYDFAHRRPTTSIRDAACLRQVLDYVNRKNIVYIHSIKAIYNALLYVVPASFGSESDNKEYIRSLKEIWAALYCDNKVLIEDHNDRKKIFDKLKEAYIARFGDPNG